MLSMERELSKVYKTSEMDDRDLLRNFLLGVRLFIQPAEQHGVEGVILWKTPSVPLSLGTDNLKQLVGHRNRRRKVRKDVNLEIKATEARGLQGRKKWQFSHDAV